MAIDPGQKRLIFYYRLPVSRYRVSVGLSVHKYVLSFIKQLAKFISEQLEDSGHIDAFVHAVSLLYAKRVLVMSM